MEAAKRCQESGKKHGVSVDIWEATTPKDDPEEQFKALGWPTGRFHNKWNKPEAAMAAFLSHSGLWRACSVDDDCFLILEHDALIVDRVPNLYAGEKICCNVAKPSFGKFRTPSKNGFQPFSSNPLRRQYFKGLHGYIVSPSGAREMLQKCIEAEPADTFVNKQRFGWLTEWYPWSVVCEDSFSTIQEEAGCLAKHRNVKPI